ncbi:hypothetical protein NEDG_02170 [Nematocida displodere]|uniref:Uncharacterized protein n=1 Tax=Nematocida displodere TaxID=1805483 RepID=A0A177EL21_9MICR|nr:hypothetical protein NEDG_02170 [Nematocida displodere]
MDKFEIETERPRIPWAIGRSVCCVVMSTAYVNMVLCEISDPTEVLVTILAGSASILALYGPNSRVKLLISSLVSGLLLFIPNGLFRAGCAGAVAGYSQTVSEIYTARLSLKAFRADAVSFLNFVSTMQACVIFFLLAFTSFGDYAKSFGLAVVTIAVQAFLILYWVPIPPIEIIKRNLQGNSLIYGDVYTMLTDLFKGAPFPSFHSEYSEIVDLSNGKTLPIQSKAWAVAQKVNVSFLTTAILGVLSSDTSNSSYLVLFSCTTMFSWMHAHRSPTQHVEMCTLTVAVMLLFIVLLYEVPPMLVIIMACSVYFVPSEEGFLALTSWAIAIANIFRSLFGAAVFYFLLRNRISF